MSLLTKILLLVVVVFLSLPENFIEKRIEWSQGRYFTDSSKGYIMLRPSDQKGLLWARVVTDAKTDARGEFLVPVGKFYPAEQIRKFITPENKVKYCTQDQKRCVN